jgi:hypothetical protein
VKIFRLLRVDDVFQFGAIFVIFIEIAIARHDSDADSDFCFFKEINLKSKRLKARFFKAKLNIINNAK